MTLVRALPSPIPLPLGSLVPPPALFTLKDADGLDRVRLGDLDPRYLRNPEALGMVGFAERLFDRTDRRTPVGSGHFAALWAEAGRLLGSP
jgi:hypothetical protein